MLPQVSRHPEKESVLVVDIRHNKTVAVQPYAVPDIAVRRTSLLEEHVCIRHGMRDIVREEERPRVACDAANYME